MSKTLKVGLCTGGGDCPGLNAAIRAVVKAATSSGRIEIIGVFDSFNGLIADPPRTRSLGQGDVLHLLTMGGTILGTSNQGSPFRDAKTSEASLTAIKKSWRTLDLAGMLVIGGDGTQSMSLELIKAGYKVIGIPKTIDNDLPGTDSTIGFSTAVDIATDAAARLVTTAEAHNRVMILEVMGRDAGHIALHAGIAGGASVVLIPEIPFDYDRIVSKLNERRSTGRTSSLVVVAEGAFPKGGAPIFQGAGSGRKEKALGGISAHIADRLFTETGVETRVTVLGHIQRGGPPNAQDKILATWFGTKAVDLVKKSQWNQIVGVRAGKLITYGFDELPEGRRVVPLNDPLLEVAESVGINLGR